MNRYRYVFFDADGTLFDFAAAETNAFRALASEMGFPGTDETLQLYTQLNQRCWEKFERGEISLEQVKTKRFADFFRARSLAADPAKAGARFVHYLSEQGIVYPQSRQVLTELSKRGYRLFLASNGISAVQRGRLEVSGLTPFFDDIFISEEMGIQKPDARFFSLMLERTGLEKERSRCLMVGDTLSSDIRGGKNGGIDTVWIASETAAAPSDCTPTFRIASLTDIVKILVPLH